MTTLPDLLRTDFDITLRAIADHIAQTYTGPEDTRIEIAHAIARHLGLEGWPSASAPPKTITIDELIAQREEVRPGFRERIEARVAELRAQRESGGDDGRG